MIKDWQNYEDGTVPVSLKAKYMHYPVKTAQTICLTPDNLLKFFSKTDF